MDVARDVAIVRLRISVEVGMSSERVEHLSSDERSIPSRWSKISRRWGELKRTVLDRMSGKQALHENLRDAYRIDPEQHEKSSDEFCKTV